eukprot:gene11385-15318_t
MLVAILVALHTPNQVSSQRKNTTMNSAQAMLEHGVTLADLRGISGDELDALYQIAHADYTAGQYLSALAVALQLVQHSPIEARYQFLYALCLQQVGQPKSALNHYAVAWALDRTNAALTFHMGECHAALGDLEAATDAFEASFELGRLHPDWRELQDLAEENIRSLRIDMAST